ncbi:MAG TPA: hypothetical protein DCF62_07840, partial [Porticoccaceae bacterium]|nr:hypothetical protein [Porticoccaceae bacterium]
AGITSMIGDQEVGPYIPIAALGDTMTAAHALAAINAALYHRATGGGGQYVDVCLLDCYFHSHEMNVGMISASKGEYSPVLPGRHHGAVGPLGVFKSKDGYIILIAILGHWPKLVDVMGMPELLDDPRFIDDPTRAANRDILQPIIEEWLQSHESDEEIIRKLGERHIPVAPILSIEQAMNHPHMKEHGTVRTVTDRGAGAFDIPGMPLRFSAYANDLDLQAPYLGEHTEEILGGLLNMNAEEISILVEKGILVREPLPDAAT